VQLALQEGANPDNVFEVVSVGRERSADAVELQLTGTGGNAV
jgi:hypothetical protein